MNDRASSSDTVPAGMRSGAKGWPWRVDGAMTRRAGVILLALGLVATGATPPEADVARWQRAWKTDFSRLTVPSSEIVAGGPPRDGIPPIDAPRFEAASDTKRYAGREPVIALSVGSETRAYPLSVLTWHEIVNDVVGGRPVAVTYCPLCNASIVFDRSHDAQVLSFGTTGLLRNSDLIMYDRQTESWWQQFTGEAIAGQFAGQSLTMLPSQVMSFAEFRRMNPQSMVLVPANPALRPYGKNPYVAYDTRAEPYALFQGRLPDGIDPMARVVVVPRQPQSVAVSLALLRERGQMSIEGVDLKWSEGVASALDRDRIADGRDVGAVTIVETTTGRPLAHHVTFAFVAFAFHPELPILTEAGLVTLKPRPEPKR